MIPDEARDIVSMLVAKSGQGRLAWERPSFALWDDVFRVILPKYTIQISRPPGSVPKSQALIELEVIDSRSAVVFSFETSPEDSDYETMTSLLELARHRGNKVDKVLADLRGVLAAV